jgi:hypothetical protein
LLHECSLQPLLLPCRVLLLPLGYLLLLLELLYLALLHSDEVFHIGEFVLL